LPNFTAINYAFLFSFIFLSKSKYDALTDAQRVQLDAVADVTEQEQWRSLPDRIKQNYRNLAIEDVKVATIMDSAFVDKLNHAGNASVEI